MGSEEDDLTEEQVQTGMKNVLFDGLTTRAMITLTEGIFLIAFARKLGAPLFVIGLLAAIPPLAQLIQIPSIYIIEKYRNRRKISIYAAFGSRLSLLLLVLIPFVFSSGSGFTAELAISVILVSIFLRGAFGAIASTSWNSWIRDLIPEKRLGSFFSKRWGYSTAFSIPLSLVAGFFIARWEVAFPAFDLEGYSILFLGGFIAGMIGLYFLYRTPEPKMVSSSERKGILKTILSPFGDDNYKRLIMFLGSWNFTIFLASPFFVIYLLERLGFDMSVVIGFTVLTQVTNVIFFSVWGRFTDSYSNKSVLGVSGPLFLVGLILWTFTAMPDRYVLTIPLLAVIHVLMGISLAGINLAVGNIALKLAPRGKSTSYLAANSFVSSLAIGLGPILGGVLANVLSGYELSLTLDLTTPSGALGIRTLSFQGLDFVFFVAFLIGIYSLYRLSFVVEEGEIEKKVVWKELVSEFKRPLATFSSASGMLSAVQYPLAVVKRRLNRNKKND